MSGQIGYLLVTGAVWAALIVLLTLAIVAAIRGYSGDRVRERRLVSRARSTRVPRPDPALHAAHEEAGAEPPEA